MNCRGVERLLSHHRDGRLAGRKARAVAAHLRHCGDCDRLRQEIAAAEAAFRDLPDPLPPSGIERRAVLLWIGQREAPHRGRGRAFPEPVVLAFPARRPLLQTVVLLAALLLAVLGLELPAAGGIPSPSPSCRAYSAVRAGAAACVNLESV